jgi:nickel-dependent lactate racemase
MNSSYLILHSQPRQKEAVLVDVWVPYGKTEICARIPTRNYLGNIEPKEKEGAKDPKAEVLRALNEPIGTRRLDELVKPGNKIAIVVNDHTRSTPTHLIVPPILEELNKAGIPDSDVTIIFGCGTHRAPKPNEQKTILGEEIIQRIKTVSHDCRAKDLVYLSRTKTHVNKIYVNKVFAEADFRILTNNIELHYYAGYGGGRKSVLPAVSGEETIQHNHAMILNPKARTGVLEGNPVHEDMVEAARLAKADFIVNVVTNSRNEIVKAFAGDMEQAFYEGVKLVDEMYKVPIERRADIVIVSSGGHPHDINLYQAHKGVENAQDAVKRGGVIIWVAECPDGHGDELFYEWMVKFKDPKELEAEVKRHFRLGGHKAYYLTRTLQRVQIILVSTLPDYYAVGAFRLRTARALNDALRDAFDLAGKDARVWVMPHGNVTLPIVHSSE